MAIKGINIASQNHLNIKQSQQDSYEINIKKQISQLQEKMKDISEDEEKTAEQKTKEKQAAQEQLQNLNNELKQHQLQKRQEEEAKKQEAIKQAMEEANAAPSQGDAENGPPPAVLGSKESGVMISLSATNDQIAGMVRIRTQLEGRQLTAETEEERAALQKKINNISKGIGQKLTHTKDTISDYHKTAQPSETKRTPASTQPQKKDEVFWTDTKPKKENGKQPVSAQNKPFENASYVIK